MTAAAIAWGHKRWPDCRVIREFALGNRRVDLMFVAQRDIIGLEIKSGADTLKRLEGQIREYQRYMPEVWLAIAPKWQDHDGIRYAGRNMIVIDTLGQVVEYRKGDKPYRDELVCSRLLELLWYDEASRIAVRTDVIPLRVPKQIHPSQSPQAARAPPHRQRNHRAGLS